MLFSFFLIFSINANAYWIFFKDKGIGSSLKERIQLLRKKYPERTLRRREKVKSPFSYEDLPVFEEYVREVCSLPGVKLRVRSKWFNAISIEVRDEGVLNELRRFPFVKKIAPVAKRKIELPKPECVSEPRPSFYGPSYNQLQMLNIPLLHMVGIKGEGVNIGMLDTGFNLSHRAFDSLRVIATYDFIFGDTNVAYDPSQDSLGQADHGTITLSTLAGFAPNNLVGPAWKANFFLAKTEWIASETPVEEDYYIRGLEWLDSLGVDVVSSSLGYSDWYEYEDMDGNTALTTIAVDIAASHGVLVVTAMGNRGNWEGSIIAPADADSCISVGAVDSLGNLASFSSIGPTYDGRIKPELVAQGIATVAVYPRSENFFFRYSGTSMSTPLIAGACALILQVHPEWGPMEVREALMRAGSNKDNPDCYIGWGIPDVYSAVHQTQVVEKASFHRGEKARIFHSLGALEKISLFDVLGRKLDGSRKLRRGVYFLKSEKSKYPLKVIVLP